MGENQGNGIEMQIFQHSDKRSFDIDMRKLLILLCLFTITAHSQMLTSLYRVRNVDWVWTLSSTGTGAGVSTLQLVTNTTTTMTINGNGTFYDDAGGTTNPGTTRTITSGATRTFYLKVTSGTSTLNILQGRSYITKVNAWTSSTNAASVAFNISTMPPGLTYFYVNGNNIITGTLWFPTGMTFFYVTGSNTISGTIPSFPTGFYELIVQGSNTISGTIPSFPTGFNEFYVVGSNTINAYTNSFSTIILNYVRLVPVSPGGLSANDCANFIIALSTVTWSGSSRTLYLKGTNATPTPSSALTTALAALAAQSVTVTTN